MRDAKAGQAQPGGDGHRFLADVDEGDAPVTCPHEQVHGGPRALAVVGHDGREAARPREAVEEDRAGRCRFQRGEEAVAGDRN